MGILGSLGGLADLGDFWGVSQGRDLWGSLGGSGVPEGLGGISGGARGGSLRFSIQLGPVPHRSSIWTLLQDFQSLRYIDGLPSSFQFFLPLGAGGALHLPPAAFLPPSKEKRLPPELPLPKQLVCRWSKVSGGGWESWGVVVGMCGSFEGMEVVMTDWETTWALQGWGARRGILCWGEDTGLEGHGRALWDCG